jgi:hypothetical protein
MNKLSRRNFFTLLAALFGGLLGTLASAWSNHARDKAAADAVNAYTRRQLREAGFFRRIMPPSVVELDYVIPFRVRRPNESADAYAARLRGMFYKRAA